MRHLVHQTLLAAGVAACSVAVARAQGPAAEAVQTESPDWTGLTRWLGAGRGARLDIRTGHLDLETLNPKTGVAIIAPEAPLPAADLLRFVREGGRLLVADEGEASAELWAGLGLRAAAAPSRAQPALAGHPGFVILTPDAIGVFDGVERLVTNHPAAFAETPLDAAVRYADGTPFGFQLAVGNGEVVVVADSSLFINLMQTVPENARFAANAMAWLAEDGTRPVHLLSGADSTRGDYTGVAPPDEALGGAATLNRGLARLSTARPDDPAVRFFVALLLAATCIYALAVFPGAGSRRRPPGPRFPGARPRRDDPPPATDPPSRIEPR